MVGLEARLGHQDVHQLEGGGGTLGHGYGYGAVQLDYGGRGEVGQLGVEVDDAGPVGGVGGAGSGVAGGYGGLQGIRTTGAAWLFGAIQDFFWGSRFFGAVEQFFGAIEGGQATADQELIPAGAVLVEKEDGFAGGSYAGGGAGGLDFHQGYEAVDFRLLRG